MTTSTVATRPCGYHCPRHPCSARHHARTARQMPHVSREQRRWTMGNNAKALVLVGRMCGPGVGRRRDGLQAATRPPLRRPPTPSCRSSAPAFTPPHPAPRIARPSGTVSMQVAPSEQTEQQWRMPSPCWLDAANAPVIRHRGGKRARVQHATCVPPAAPAVPACALTICREQEKAPK